MPCTAFEIRFEIYKIVFEIKKLFELLLLEKYHTLPFPNMELVTQVASSVFDLLFKDSLSSLYLLFFIRSLTM